MEKLREPAHATLPSGSTFLMTQIPALIGKYRITAQIAKGGMGAVFKAEHPTLGRTVVLKKLVLHGNPSLIERFRREARIMMDFRNEYIVDVYDHFKEDAAYYIVLEYVDGLSLDRLIERERYLPDDIALLIYLDCARALKYAHDRNVVHRDIKPQNILISSGGKAKLTDFGIAVSNEFAEDTLTREGTIMGTPSYMSPEQLGNTRSVDKRTDIYSLGATLYEMVTGKAPYPGNFSPETVTRIQKGKYRPPQRINPRISTFTRRIIRKSLRPEKDKRYADLSEVIEKIEKYFHRKNRKIAQEAVQRYMRGEPVTVIPERRILKVRRWASKVLILVLALGAAALYIERSGYAHEYFLSGTHGLLRLSASLPAGLKPEGKAFVHAELYRETGDAPVPLPHFSFEFSPAPARSASGNDGEDPASVTWVSQSRYIPAGAYRLFFSVENELHVRSFYLEPRVKQIESPFHRDGTSIDIVLDQPPSLPVGFTYSVGNRNTGLDITPEVSLFMRIDERWVPWDPFFADYLRSGHTYRFLFVRDQFYPAEYTVSVPIHQSDLSIRAVLAPHPGYLRISSNEQDIQLLINNTRTYLSGGITRDLRQLEPTGVTPQVLELPPGSYILTAMSSRFVTRDMRVSVRSDTITEVVIRYDPESAALTLTVQE